MYLDNKLSGVNMPNTVIKDNHITLNGVSYFRGHAEETRLGSIGEMRQSPLRMNYLDVKDQIPPKKIKVIKSSIIAIDFSRLSKTDIGSAVKAIIPIGGVPVPTALDVNTTFEMFKSGELKLVKFSVRNNDMIRACNGSPRKLENLINWGKDARVVLQILSIMDAKLASKFDNNVESNLSVGEDNTVKATVNVSHSKQGELTVTFSEGTTFAYLLGKFDWDANLRRNKTKIVDIDIDQWGPG